MEGKKMFSKAIFGANWKRFWIVPAVTTILLFLGITFQLNMEVKSIEKRKQMNGYQNNVVINDAATTSQTNNITNTIANEENSVSVLQEQSTQPEEARYLLPILYNFLNVAIIFVLPVLLSILLFAYMNEEKSSSFIHGLPIAKKRLYSTNSITGISMYVVPYVINMVLLLALQFGTMGNYLATVQLWKWFGISLLYLSLFFSFATMVGMFCASKISHGILTYILMYAPIGLVALFTRILEQIIYGFNAFSNQVENLALKIPFIQILQNFDAMRYSYTNMQNQTIQTKTVLIYFVVTAILFLIGYFLYHKRKLEITKEFIAFPSIQAILKYAATFTINLLAYAYFFMVFEENKITSIIASIFLTCVAYFIIEMILQKTYRVFSASKGFLVYGILVSVAYCIAINGAFGFETRIPSLEQIKEIALTKDGETILFDERQNIETIRALHEKIIEERKQGYYNTFLIEYTLQNGKKCTRKYSLPYSAYETQIKTIYSSEEYQEERIKILQNYSAIEEIEIRYRRQNSWNSLTRKIEDKYKEDFMNLLLQDIKEKKAILQGRYSSVVVETIKQEGEEIFVSIRFQDGTYRSISYTTTENIHITPYIKEKT